MLTRTKCKKELRFISVFTSIGHSEDTSSCELKSLMKLISERPIVDRIASHACSSWISSLYHKARDESMEDSV